jgi:caffeoyl-CoA O-methyltransferase
VSWKDDYDLFLRLANITSRPPSSEKDIAMTGPVQDLIDSYLRALFGAEDDALIHIRSNTVEQGLPQINVAPEEGRLIHFLLRACGAKRVVEIGTLAGYSGTWIARALPEDGRLITVERDAHHAEVAQESFARAGVSERVEIRVGGALDILATLSVEGPFDGVFIDANKGDYPQYLAWAVNNIRVGGIILAHNALWGGAVVDHSLRPGRDLDALLAFNQQIATDPRLLGMIIPLGDGLAAALRIA